MKNYLLTFLIIGTIIFNVKVGRTQTLPSITYSTPQTFIQGTPSAILSPTNTGGAVYPSNYNSVASFASYFTPFSIDIDKANNIYVTNNSTGDLTKFSQSGTILFNVNTGNSQASEVAIDALGNVYVSQFTVNLVLKYSSAGVLLATIPGFNDPYGITFDTGNNAYVANFQTGTISKIAAGTNVATTYLTGFKTPYGITTDVAGNLYVSEQGVGDIIKVTAGSLTKTVFASGFNGPRHLNSDQFGNVYVADFANNAFKKISAAGKVTSLFASGLSNPRQGAFDSAGNLYIADYGSNSIKKSIATSYSINSPLPTGLIFNTTTGQISGTPTTSSSAASYLITAYNTFGTGTAPLAITVKLPQVPPVVSITAPINVSANQATLNGYVYAKGAATTVSFSYFLSGTTPAITAAAATGGNILAGDSSAVTLPLTGLKPASTYFYKISATNSFGTTTTTTNSFTTPSLSNNAGVTSMTLSTGSLLTYGTGPYNVNNSTSVSRGTSSFYITTKTVDPAAIITVNGHSAANGAPYSVPLNIALPTLFVVIVKSPDGTVTKSFGITVYQIGSNNTTLGSLALSSGSVPKTTATNAYSAIVSPNTNTINVLAIPQDPNARVSVNGVSVPNGSSSGPIALNSTAATNILILVTAENGVNTNLTTVSVSRSGANIVWTGSGTDSNWSTIGNWSPAVVPGPGDVASFGEVPYTGMNQPIISSATLVGELAFGQYNSPLVTIAAGNKLTVGTRLTVDTGATPSFVSSTPATAFVDIAPGAVVNVIDTGILVINQGVQFTLKSNASGSASIGQITTNSVLGTVNVERYITGGSNVYRGYRFLSSPVYANSAGSNNIYSLNYVQLTSLVTGTTGTAGGFNSAGNASLYLFRENITSDTTSGGGNFRGINNLKAAPTYNFDNEPLTYNIPVGNGYEFFFRGDNIHNLANKYLSTTSAESVVMTAAGTLNAGPIAVHDWYTPNSANLGFTNTLGNTGVQGYNLVGNPYASSINWDTYNQSTPTSGIYAPNISNTIYMLDPVSKHYGVYMANSPFSGTNNASNIIVSGQGFIVQALNANAALTFNEDAKTTSQVYGPNLLLGKPAQNVVSQYLHLKLNQDSTQVDEAYISFKGDASARYVFNEDAPQKPDHSKANLASISSDGIPLTINTLALHTDGNRIALSVKATYDGTYAISAPEIKSVPQLYDVWLIDRYKKDSLSLRNQSVYTFNILKSDTASYGTQRFSLVIRQNPALTMRLLDFAASKAIGGVQLVWQTANEENYTNFTVERSTDGGVKFNVLGGFVSSSQANYSFRDKAPLVAANQYRLKLVDLNGVISYSKVVTLMYSNLSDNIVNKSISIYPNPAKSIINITFIKNFESTGTQNIIAINNTTNTDSAVVYGIKIVNNTGTVIKTATTTAQDWETDVSNLMPGTYYIEVVNNIDKTLVGKGTFLKL